MNKRAKKILYFWFEEIAPDKRFSKNKNLDKKIRKLFFGDYDKAINDQYNNWINSPSECLALIILLDQFSRNLFRSNPKAFAMDKKAVSISRHAIKNKFHEILKLDQKFFIFLPFMHSEEMKDQIYCENLINKFLLNHSNYKDIIKFSKIHKEIIKKFGRFPYRNKVLNRKNTKDEEEYLNSNHYDFFNV